MIPAARAVDRRPWWRRLLAWRPWAPAPLAVDACASHAAGMAAYRVELAELERSGPPPGEPSWWRPIPPPHPPVSLDELVHGCRCDRSLDEEYRTAKYAADIARWRGCPDGRPAPTMLPGPGMPAPR